MIGYPNVNSPRNKIADLRDILQCVSLDFYFLVKQSHITPFFGYIFTVLRKRLANKDQKRPNQIWE